MKPERRHNRPIIAVEAGNDWLKVLKAEHSGSKIAVSDLYLEKLESPGIVPRNVLGGIFKKIRSRGCEVIALLPRWSMRMKTGLLLSRTV